MHQFGFFDLHDRYEQLSRAGDPLERLNAIIDWKIFLPTVQKAFFRQRKSEAGRKPYNRLLMFKLLVLQSLYNLSDHQVEFQVRDRLSFMRFLGLQLGDKVPDEKTLWSFREILVQGRVVEKLFNKFNGYLERQGFEAKLGHIIDATLVEVPRQRNSREDNQTVKSGEIPESFKKNPNRARQKDMEARWTMKRNQAHYGYKDHIDADANFKLIRSYEVTPANVGDIHCLEDLLKKSKNKDTLVWADAAYYSDAMEEKLKKKGLASRIIKRLQSHQPEFSQQDRESRRRAKIRKRVEHVFGFMENSMGGKFIRTIGLLRARAKIGLMNLGYNLCRYEQLCRIGVS